MRPPRGRCLRIGGGLGDHADLMHVLATAALGTADLVERECRSLGLDVLGRDRDGVHLDLGWRGVARALVHLRVATRLLLRLGDVAASTAEELYDGARTIAWTDWLDDRATFAVFASGDLVPGRHGQRGLDHHVFVSQKVKDALCDSLRDKYRRRPDVNVQDPDVRVTVRGRHGRWSFWLDLSDPPLHERGLGRQQLTAPLKETLAAAVAMRAAWTVERPLRDPFCGSGTLLVETLGLALGLAPGATRWFGGERWPLTGALLQAELDTVRAAAVEHARTTLAHTAGLDVEASDNDQRAVNATRENLRHAGLDRLVRVVRRDARDLAPLPPHTTIVTNPPYGERLNDGNMTSLYTAMGQNWAGAVDLQASILMGHTEFVASFGWPVARAEELRNGALQVGLFHYRTA